MHLGKTLLALAVLLLIPSFSLAGKKAVNHYTDEPITKLPKGSKILYMPLVPNQNLKENEIEPINNEILAQLKNAGANVKKAAITDTKLRSDYMLLFSSKTYTSGKARKMKEHFVGSFSSKYNLVVVPSVYTTTGEMTKSYISFDGARIPILTDKGSYSWSGTQRGLSLRIEVYSNTGQWLMNIHGGIAMPQSAVMKSKTFNRKEFLFADKKDKKALKKGVSITLKPFKKKFKFK